MVKRFKPSPITDGLPAATTVCDPRRPGVARVFQGGGARMLAWLVGGSDESGEREVATAVDMG
jgi:hypothetical protein